MRVIKTKIAAAVATVAIGLSIVLFGAGAPVSADNGCDLNPNSPICEIEVPNPGNPGAGGGDPGAGGSEGGGFTPGPTTCSFNGAEVPCTSAAGSWNGSCYVALQDPQPTPPAGGQAGIGAWYTCTPSDPTGLVTTFWSNNPPPGVVTYTPAQAAFRLVQRFQLGPIDIGMAPASKVHDDDAPGTAPYRRTWVGIPVWLWVENPQPLTWGPYTETATLGGVTVTATASVSSVTWTSDDGSSATCGLGTPFDIEAMRDQAAVDSPNCGFRFQKTSAKEADGTFTVTASTQWTVAWTGGGTDGTLVARNTSTSAEVTVGELQSVNTPNQDGDRKK